MVQKAATDAIKEISPPVIGTASSYAIGVPHETVLGFSLPSLQTAALILTIVYAVVRLLFLVPKAIGCGRCFYRNKTCLLTCKNPTTVE